MTGRSARCMQNGKLHTITGDDEEEATEQEGNSNQDNEMILSLK